MKFFTNYEALNEELTKAKLLPWELMSLYQDGGCLMNWGIVSRQLARSEIRNMAQTAFVIGKTIVWVDTEEEMKYCHDFYKKMLFQIIAEKKTVDHYMKQIYRLRDQNKCLLMELKKGRK